MCVSTSVGNLGLVARVTDCEIIMYISYDTETLFDPAAACYITLTNTLRSFTNLHERTLGLFIPLFCC